MTSKVSVAWGGVGVGAFKDWVSRVKSAYMPGGSGRNIACQAAGIAPGPVRRDHLGDCLGVVCVRVSMSDWWGLYKLGRAHMERDTVGHFQHEAAQSLVRAVKKRGWGRDASWERYGEAVSLSRGFSAVSGFALRTSLARCLSHGCREKKQRRWKSG